MRNWRDKFPGVEVIEEAVTGRPAERLLEAAGDTSLLIVGRRISHLPTGRYIGPTTLALLHHSSAPVAVVPYT
ncbi:universal stress protein [Streptomyces sp. SID13666]|uniref:universal stress protein n=1 Tax=unclassified Streptomyces TaxID=2593676 RepID=UPI0013C13E8B|nr:MULTISPECIES: universal stress protein [unclassified Streptomyces]NEA56562.1 universal stress protein [Streptomyces sp. SID13666]NEA72356.1 universal stress protein [Streptomyces sp. SID13588]